MKAGIVTVSNDIRQTMNQGILEAMCAAPISYCRLLLYSTLWPFVFETIRVIFYFVFGWTIFGLHLPNANWAGGIIILCLTIPIFLMLGIISGSLLILVKRGDPINWFFSSVSGILAGTMFPISVFPSWLYVVSLCLPLTHSMEAMRLCLLRGVAVAGVKVHILSLVCFVTILLPLTVFINKICMDKARRQGSFAAF
jgi:ABC-2 type transport system permease protein